MLFSRAHYDQGTALATTKVLNSLQKKRNTLHPLEKIKNGLDISLEVKENALKKKNLVLYRQQRKMDEYKKEARLSNRYPVSSEVIKQFTKAATNLDANWLEKRSWLSKHDWRKLTFALTCSDTSHGQEMRICVGEMLRGRGEGSEKFFLALQKDDFGKKTKWRKRGE